MTGPSLDRRRFVRDASLGLASLALLPAELTALEVASMNDEPLFRISLAQWSLHKSIFSGDMHPLDFPKVATEQFGIDAIEHVNGCYGRTYEDLSYIPELKRRCADHGVRSLLIMVDGEGRLGAPDSRERAEAIDNHHKWVDAATELGCHSIRVNAFSEGAPEEQRSLVADGLRRLTEHAAKQGVNVLVENHGGLSSNGAWLAGTIAAVDHPRCGTLPDFGNFTIRPAADGDPGEVYDRYAGVRELMPFAKAVSAKSNEFDDAGNEVRTDYRRMVGIVLDAGYEGWIGIEYEGGGREADGIMLTKRLLERVRSELAAAPVD